jgi:hypothetical protein
MGIKSFLFLINFTFDFNPIEWFIGIISTFVIIYFFRARINVKEIEIIKDDDDIKNFKIPVLNNSYFFSATNIIIEVALKLSEETFHFSLDRNEFILIPRKKVLKNKKNNERCFQTNNFQNSTLELIERNNHTYSSIINNLENDDIIRIRIHANHSFTNFGKAFEFNFKYKNKQFIKL